MSVTPAEPDAATDRQRVNVMTKTLPELSGTWRVSVLPDTQYSGGVLYMLGLLHVSGSFHLWY